MALKALPGEDIRGMSSSVAKSSYASEASSARNVRKCQLMPRLVSVDNADGMLQHIWSVCDTERQPGTIWEIEDPGLIETSHQYVATLTKITFHVMLTSLLAHHPLSLNASASQSHYMR